MHPPVTTTSPLPSPTIPAIVEYLNQRLNPKTYYLEIVERFYLDDKPTFDLLLHISPPERRNLPPTTRCLGSGFSREEALHDAATDVHLTLDALLR